MACICSLPFGSLLTSLPSLPNLTGLIPAMPLQLVLAINAALNVSPLALSANLSATATAQASLTANLAIMASLVAAVKAAMNLNLALPLSVSAMAHLRANLSANIHSMNAHGLMLGLALPNLMALLLSLLPLIHLMGIVVGARLAFGIDLRAPGAVLALQAALSASLAGKTLPE